MNEERIIQLLEKLVETQDKQGEELKIIKGDVHVLKGDVHVLKGDVQNLAGKVNVIANVQSMHTAKLEQIDHRLIAIETNVQELYNRTHTVERAVFA